MYMSLLNYPKFCTFVKRIKPATRADVTCCVSTHYSFLELRLPQVSLDIIYGAC